MEARLHQSLSLKWIDQLIVSSVLILKGTQLLTYLLVLVHSCLSKFLARVRLPHSSIKPRMEWSERKNNNNKLKPSISIKSNSYLSSNNNLTSVTLQA